MTRRNHYFSVAALLLLLTCFISCKKDFLEKKPLDAISIDNFFNNSNDLKSYVNGLYNAAMPLYNYQNVPYSFPDANSDFMIDGATPNAVLYQRSSSAVAPATSQLWDNAYADIRDVNIFIQNYPRVKTRTVAANQYIGEGYFFRAWHYFTLLKNFGGVPFIDKPLNTNDAQLYQPRADRSDLAMHIINDLDSAIANLSWKGQGPAGAGRINKEAALTMKARVALYEGTWERYHLEKGTPFAEAGHNGNDFLEMVAPAVQQIIDVHGANIYKDGGIFNEPYNQLFTITHGESTPGVFWYRVYDTKLLTANSHDFYSKIIDNGFAVTDRFVNMYLDADGVPQSMSQRPLSTLNEKGQNLDPRFRQTIWTPDRGPMNQLPGRTSQGDLPLRYPDLTSPAGSTPTGYRNWKGAVLGHPERYRAGEADDILIRYGEALLDMAEAKAILGTLTQNDLDITVNVLRNRVGAVPMNLSVVNSWNITYDKSMGFDPSEPNIVNEIRRERSVELFDEGFRLDDLKRWAVFEDAVNGYRPKGADLQEFLDYFNDPARLAADGCSGCIANPTLTPGSNVMADPDGLINPLFKNADFKEGGSGYFVNPRNYLSPIPQGQIDLYKLHDVTLSQNPGWN